MSEVNEPEWGLTCCICGKRPGERWNKLGNNPWCEPCKERQAKVMAAARRILRPAGQSEGAAAFRAISAGDGRRKKGPKRGE